MSKKSGVGFTCLLPPASGAGGLNLILVIIIHYKELSLLDDSEIFRLDWKLILDFSNS